MNGAFAGLWDPLTTKTDNQGVLTAAPDGFGPYMQSAPSNPINGLTNVVDGDTNMAAAGSACGFIYDYATTGVGTGRIWGTDTTKKTKFVE